MSRCFTKFPNWLFQENPTYTRTWIVLQEMGILLGGLSDFAELVGLLTGDDGVGFRRTQYIPRFGGVLQVCGDYT